MPAYLTDCGLPGIKTVPYGLHMCHFYSGREDLSATLVPYLAAGLRNNERCIWVTADPLDAAQARSALQKAGLDPEGGQREGWLTIRSHADFYSCADGLKANEVVRMLVEEGERALEAGFSGLRATGNLAFVTPQTWPAFMEYESMLSDALQGHRILALCSYRHELCGASGILDVVRHHHCALDHRDDGWQIFMGNKNGTGPQRPAPFS